MRPAHLNALAAMSGALLFANATSPAQVSDTPAQSRLSTAAAAFTLRVNPLWARQVNAVLAEVAEPAQATVPADLSAAEYLKDVCGGYEPATVRTISSEEDKQTVSFSPCARMRRDVEIEAAPGDTLEGLAARSGLARSRASDLKVARAGSSAEPAPIKPETLDIGDLVALPLVPQWTQIVARPGRISDRAGFIKALAAAVRCTVAGIDEAEACLVSRGVYVLDRAPVHRSVPEVPEAATSPVDRDRVRASVPAAAEASAALAQTAAPRVEPSGQGPAAVSAAGIPVGSIPVAPGQWPYDADLLSAILRASQPSLRLAVIAVADGGLARASGEPLPTAAFDRSGDVPNGLDDDENGYVDDVIGAGMPRGVEILGTGDIGLCGASAPDFSSWNAGLLEVASHGAVVSSVAAALPLRVSERALDGLLPRLVFFRMVADACDANAGLRVTDGEMVTAFAYLKERADIVNISYTIDSSRTRAFVTAMSDTLRYHDVLLVLPAGNDTPGDLDENLVCPACLGNDGFNTATARRTLVVGAATRALHRATFSNYGRHTVKLYAPGEPVGALDITGAQLGGRQAATSYAAPYAALGAGILRSFGIQKVDDLRDRLAAATWPLDGSAGARQDGVGVVDLVKVAAVRHDAVEVVEQDVDGSPVRRTYVGLLTDPLSSIGICGSAHLFNERAVHALRLEEPNFAGERSVRVWYRNRRDASGRRTTARMTCRPEGDIRLTTLSGGEMSFPLESVTQVLLRWFW